MFLVDLKLKSFQSEKCRLTPELISRILKSRCIVFHFLTFLWHGLLNYQTLAGAFYILFHRTDLVRKTCGFGIQYVTIWNLGVVVGKLCTLANYFLPDENAFRLPYLIIAETVIEQNYFNVCLVQDILELFPNPKYDKIKLYLRTVIPYAYSSIVNPLSILVTLNFWGIYTHHPRVIDEDDVTISFFPPWVNHGLHTTNSLLACAEMFVVYRPYPTRLRGFAGLMAVLLGYSFTCTILYFIGGVWPYPLIEMMNLWQRLIFVFGNCLLGCFIFILGQNLNEKIWGVQTADVQKKLT